jgi:hypothetical protein
MAGRPLFATVISIIGSIYQVMEQYQMSNHSISSAGAPESSPERRLNNGSRKSNLDMTILAMALCLILFGTLALVAVTSNSHTAGAGGITTTPTPSITVEPVNKVHSGHEGGAGIAQPGAWWDGPITPHFHKGL